MTIVNLNNISIGRQFSALSHPHILLTRVLGKSPLQTLQNLLTSGELELSTTDGLNNVRLASVLPANGEEDLSNIDTCGNTDGLSVRVPHTGGEPIGSGTRKHFVGADDVEGVDADADVVSVLSDGVGQVLVDGDAAGLEGLGGDLLLFVADEVGHEGEEIDGGLLGSHVVNLDFGFGHTTAVARLDVGLVLLVTVAAERTTTHLG
mmetsp:Transcript_390/g.771  ORF Transcript_390/g.771 Transcript_390/m.771 type:complete len:206 (-) Transcript_390:152-769(-)